MRGELAYEGEREPVNCRDLFIDDDLGIHVHVPGKNPSAPLQELDRSTTFRLLHVVWILDHLALEETWESGH